MSRKPTTPKPGSPHTPLSPAFPVPESLFSRLVVAPVLFVSFLVSLVLIDRKTYGSIFSHDSHDSWASAHHDEYYRSNKRKLARKEMEDAFQLRSKVIAGIVLISGILVAVLGWSGSKMFSSMVWGTTPFKDFHPFGV